VLRLALARALVWGCGGSAALAWDSTFLDGRVSTHSRLTAFAVDALAADIPELMAYRAELLAGANQELHELPVRGNAYGLDLDRLRVRHRGTNAGTDDIRGWWEEARAAYRRGDRQAAYFLLGIMLHMIQDMGVPAHAWRIHHQARPFQLDGVEVMGFFRWQPSFAGIGRRDPRYAAPWRYYELSGAWAAEDSAGYRKDIFPRFWAFANRSERELVRARQGRTAVVTAWALRSAAAAFRRR
jgi:hypothetical protein